MKNHNVYIIPCGRPNNIMNNIGRGMRNAAWHYAVSEQYSKGVFYLFVPKEYPGVIIPTEDFAEDKSFLINIPESSFYYKSSLLLLLPGKQIVDLKGYMNNPVPDDLRTEILSYIDSLPDDENVLAIQEAKVKLDAFLENTNVVLTSENFYKTVTEIMNLVSLIYSVPIDRMFFDPEHEMVLRIYDYNIWIEKTTTYKSIVGEIKYRYFK